MGELSDSQANATTTTSEVATAETGIDDLVARLRSRVAERREAGDYPEDLEAKLEEHFHRIVFHRAETHVDQLRADVEAIDSHMDFAVKFVNESNVPGGEVIHRVINKAIARTASAMAQQMQDFADATRRALRTLATAVQDPNSHVHGDLIGHIDAIIERLNSYERAPESSDAAIGDLRRRIEDLERAEAARNFKPWFTNDAFEEQFRATREEIYAAYDEMANRLGKSAPVFDFGCGRGEFLELLTKKGVECRGVEIDPVLAEDARKAGLDVVAGDGIKLLAAEKDESLGGLTLLQVIEHLTIQQQLDLVALAYEKLRPGGIAIVETVNPQSLYVYAHAFYLDPTHTRPVHPAYLSFLFEQAGFSEVKWEWRNPPPAQDILEPESDDANSAANRNVERLNRLLFEATDYALIVTK
jgi:SAM-dependent methyltransferase